MARAILVLKMLRIDRGFPGFRGLLRGGFVFCAVALLIPTACGSSEDDPPPTDPSGGRAGDGNDAGEGGTSGSGGSNGGSGGSGGSTDPGGAGGDGGRPPDGDPLAPVVRVTSPEEIEDPEDGALVKPEVDVLCTVTQSTEDGSAPVDPSTVVIQLLRDNHIVEEKPGTETDTGVYTARFVLTAVPNGIVSFVCSAEDTSTPPLVGTDTIWTFVDHGPVIEVIRPEPDSAHPLMGDIAFDFTVMPDPLAEGDSGAEVDAVSLDVLGVDIPLDEHAPGQFRASVTLSDAMMFPDRTMTVPVLIRASNARTPEPGERLFPYTILIDEQGPSISITSPQEEDVVGKTVELQFTVVDALTDVDDATVSVAVNRGTPVFFDPNPLGPWSKEGNAYAYLLDTTTISGSVAQMTVNVNARDVAGNQARGESIVLFLDNQAPIVDLDPGYVREFRDSDQTCSHAWDPVGALSADDGQAVQQAQRFRALVWAVTNQAPGQTVIYHSPTDETSVYLYLRDRPGPDSPLLEDTDGDGVCDEIIDRQSLPDLHLSPMPPGGSSWFGGPGDEPADAPPMPQGCDYADSSGGTPTYLCDDRSDMWRTISHTMDGKPPVIYALGSNLTGSGAACSGADWEIGFAREGWVCVAGRAEDQVHNIGVSAPLRLCYDDGVDPPADCPLPAPSCLDDCTLPPRFVGGLYEP
jgi:hypothetical protein